MMSHFMIRVTNSFRLYKYSKSPMPNEVGMEPIFEIEINSNLNPNPYL